MRLPLFFRLAIALSALLVINGCAKPAPASNTIVDKTPQAADNGMPPVILPPKVTAIGYGTLPVAEGLSLEQRRLLAIRASKLDAYRSLAETVAGLKITGNTTVSAVVVTNDSFRVYVEAYLRGARVLTVTPLPGGSYETVLELTLGGDFYRDTTSALQGQPVQPPAVPAPVETAKQPSAPAPAPAPVTTGPSTNFYLAK